MFVAAKALLEKSGKKGYMEGLYQLGMIHLENADIAKQRVDQVNLLSIKY